MCSKRDDRDSCDGLVGNGCGVGNIVTVVTAVTGKSLGGVQGALFKGRPPVGVVARRQQGQRPSRRRRPIPLGERKGAFDGVAVKSAFALLSQKVTKAAAPAAKKERDNVCVEQ